MLNTVSLQGRVVENPELRHTKGGRAVTSWVLACERTYVKDNIKTADFITCVAWEKTAEFVCKYFHKGNGMCVDGRLQTRVYDDRLGNKHHVTEVVVNNVFFSIREKQEKDEFNQAPPEGYEEDFSQIVPDDVDLPF